MGKNPERTILDLSPEQIEKRYWSRVDRTSTPDGCWPWVGYRGGHGYGRLTVRYQDLLSHRIAYTLEHGTIPDGLWVLHECDNPACCNPAHLWLGTNEENSADRHRKGRSACGDKSGARTKPERRPTGDRHWTKTHPEILRRGESLHNAKFDEESVRSIRVRFAAGQATAPELAREYDVTRQAIHAIIKRKLWKHVA